VADDWFDRFVDQDWAGETQTRDRRDRDPGGRIPAPGETIDLRDLRSETGPRETETRDQAAERTETDPVDLGKTAKTAKTDGETTETETDSSPAEDETEQDQQSAYDAIADALVAAAGRLPTAEDAAEARRDIVRSKRARATLYNTSAAAAGLLPAAAGADWTAPGTVTGWLDNIAADASIGAALILGTALAGIVWAVWDRRTRALPPWAAWACRIPLASVVAGVLLWAPAWPALNL
jgi:hypothetical protein